MMHANVVLADDHQIVRQGLRSLLSENPDLNVVGEAPDGREAVKLCAELNPEIVIMDVAMPGLNGIDATRQIHERHPGTSVVALSMHADRRFINEMLRAGAKAYLLKESAFEELSAAIDAVLAGKIYLSPRIAEIVGPPGAPRETRMSSVFDKLTKREREVLQLMAEGRSTKQIAMDLQVSVKTVETHRRQIMEKLDIHSVAELTKYAIREGLTTVEA
jgi:DNA-binding NarL/FixJ family response regulator